MTVDQITESLRQLVRERQALRDRGAGRAELELNRRAIVSRQWQLSYALVESHRPPLSSAA